MIAPAQRHTRRAPCPVCEGSESDRRGRGERCHGFTSDDGKYAYCSREEYAGDLDQPAGPLHTYRHYLQGPCRCGVDHSSGAPAPQIHPHAPRAVEAPKPPTRSHLRKKPDAIYEYRALETGAPLRKLRYGSGKSKTFTWQRPDGAGDWIDGREGAQPDVYGAESLADADPFEPLAICEGEKDRNKLLALGWRLVISPPDGKGSWREEYNHYAAGRNVVIFTDKDADGGGQEHAANVAKNVAGGAFSVRGVLFEDAHDVGDWIDAGGTLAELRRLCGEASIISAWQPSAQQSNPAPQDGSPTQTQKTHCPNCKQWEDRARIAEASLARLRWKENMRERILAMPPEQLSPAAKPAAIACVDILSQPKARGEDGMVQIYRAEIARRTGTTDKTAGAHLQAIDKAGIIRRELRKSFDMSELRIAEGPLYNTPEQVTPQAPKWGGKRVTMKACPDCRSTDLDAVCKNCGARHALEDLITITVDVPDEAEMQDTNPAPQDGPPETSDAGGEHTQQNVSPPSDIFIVGDLEDNDAPADAREALLAPVRALAAERNYPALRIAGGRVTLAPTPAAWEAFLTRADAESIWALLGALDETAATTVAG